MKGKFILFITLILASTSKGQNIFSVLHLNEERDLHRGTPKQITETIVFYNSKGTERKKRVTEYDQAGLPVSGRSFNDDESVASITTYKYDTVRRIILQRKINEVNVRFRTSKIGIIYQYEAANSPTRIQYLNFDGNVVSEVRLKNDSLGLPVELLLFEPVGNLIGVELASYIPKENKAIVSVANTKGEIISTDTMKISFKEAHKFNDPNITYNVKGDVISSMSRWPDGSIHYSEYDYVYDGAGNWVEQQVFDVIYKSNDKKKRKLKSHFKREIFYWR
jgi:hypothetical protein